MKMATKSQCIQYHTGLYATPLTVKQLTDGICNCAGLIVGRLHTSILAYAYDIPCVSLVWNHKQTMFGEQTGHGKYFSNA